MNQLVDFLKQYGDVQYLAGLIADPNAFTAEEFEEWVKDSTWYMISEYAIAQNLAESPICMDVAKKWIDGSDENLQYIA